MFQSVIRTSIYTAITYLHFKLFMHLVGKVFLDWCFKRKFIKTGSTFKPGSIVYKVYSAKFDTLGRKIYQMSTRLFLNLYMIIAFSNQTWFQEGYKNIQELIRINMNYEAGYYFYYEYSVAFYTFMQLELLFSKLKNIKNYDSLRFIETTIHHSSSIIIYYFSHIFGYGYFSAVCDFTDNFTGPFHDIVSISCIFNMDKVFFCLIPCGIISWGIRCLNYLGCSIAIFRMYTLDFGDLFGYIFVSVIFFILFGLQCYWGYEIIKYWFMSFWIHEFKTMFLTKKKKNIRGKRTRRYVKAGIH